MKSKLVPIVDADSIIYRCGFASDGNKDADGNPEPLSYCLHSVKESITRILDVFEPSERTRILLQGGGNYRDRVATILPYKGNRDPSKRPVYYDEIREYLIEYFGAELITGMETDDACGIEQWANKDRSTCIVSIDKDLDMIPGWHYDYVNLEMYYVDLATANRTFWLQVLTGDDTDNILGCGIRKEGVYKSGKKKGQTRFRREGVGPKEAESYVKLGDSWVDQFNAVRKQFDKHFGANGEAAFHENATLIWMQREYMINYDGSKIEFGTESYEEVSEESVPIEGADEDATLA